MWGDVTDWLKKLKKSNLEFLMNLVQMTGWLTGRWHCSKGEGKGGGVFKL